MRYIHIPEDVTLMAHIDGQRMVDESGQPHKPYSMARWLTIFILADGAMAEDGRKGLRAVRSIRKAFANAKAGDVVPIEDDPWERAKNVIEKQDFARKLMKPTALEQFLEFVDAWLEAKDTLQQVEALKEPERATA